jgi:hypothetical protein
MGFQADVPDVAGRMGATGMKQRSGERGMYSSSHRKRFDGVGVPKVSDRTAIDTGRSGTQFANMSM